MIQEPMIFTLLTSLLIVLIVSNNISLLTDYLKISGITKRKLGSYIVAVSMILGMILEGYKMKSFTESMLINDYSRLFTLIILISMFLLGNMLRLPTSATLSTVGVLVGVSIYYGRYVDITTLSRLFTLWLISPLLGIVMAYFLYSYISKNILDTRITKMIAISSTIFLGYTFGVNTLGLIASLSLINFYVDIPIYTLSVILGSTILSAKMGEVISKTIHSYTIKTYTSISLATALIIEVASNLSIPIPLTSLITLTLIGPVLSKKTRFMNLKIFKKTILFWIFIPLLSALLATLSFIILSLIYFPPYHN